MSAKDQLKLATKIARGCRNQLSVAEPDQEKVTLAGRMKRRVAMGFFLGFPAGQIGAHKSTLVNCLTQEMTR